MAAVRHLEEQGAIVSEVSIPMHKTALSIWYGVFLEGAAEFMVKGHGTGTNWWGYYNTHMLDHYARGWLSRPDDLPHGVKTTLLLGEYMHRYYHGRYYAKAQNLRHLARQAYDDVLESYDVLVMPTIPFLSNPIPDPECSIEDAIYYALCMINNCPQFNLTGHPAISVPCGMEDNCPIGMMIAGKHFDDLTVLQVADAVEKSGDWKRM